MRGIIWNYAGGCIALKSQAAVGVWLPLLITVNFSTCVFAAGSESDAIVEFKKALSPTEPVEIVFRSWNRPRLFGAEELEQLRKRFPGFIPPIEPQVNYYSGIWMDKKNFWQRSLESHLLEGTMVDENTHPPGNVIEGKYRGEQWSIVTTNLYWSARYPRYPSVRRKGSTPEPIPFYRTAYAVLSQGLFFGIPSIDVSTIEWSGYRFSARSLEGAPIHGTLDVNEGLVEAVNIELPERTATWRLVYAYSANDRLPVNIVGFINGAAEKTFELDIIKRRTLLPSEVERALNPQLLVDPEKLQINVWSNNLRYIKTGAQLAMAPEHEEDLQKGINIISIALLGAILLVPCCVWVFSRRLYHSI